MRVGSRRALRTMLLATLSVAGGVPASAAGQETLTIDPAPSRERVNQELLGFGWHANAPLDGVEPLSPALVRIDASLEKVSPERGELRLAPLLREVAAVRSVGAEPLVILSYTPAWLGEPLAFGRDPTRVAPADLEAWQRLIHKVVKKLATARHPALRFEAWNEPDLPLFWQDTPAAWLDTVAASARAVAAVEDETGIDLAFGGPATVVPDPVWLELFLARFRDRSLPLDFVSWHYYGNYPFLGPDGAEFAGTEALQALLGQRNPLTTPLAYRAQIELMRDLVRLGLAGTGRRPPSLLLDEWNLSAGGYDRRHDTHEGAAFAAATLTEMQRAGLDAAAFFRADDAKPPGTGDHGILFADGRRKPAWWTFRFWRQLRGRQVPLTGDAREGGVFALASRPRRRPRTVRALVVSFSALAPLPRELRIEVKGRTVARATARRIDAAHPAAAKEKLAARGGAAALSLPPQAVALVTLRLAPPP